MQQGSRDNFRRDTFENFPTLPRIAPGNRNLITIPKSQPDAIALDLFVDNLVEVEYISI